MPDIANDRHVLDPAHMLDGQNILVAGRGHNDIGAFNRVFERHHLIAVHGRLQRADRVHFGHQHARPGAAQGFGRTLAHIAITANNRHLARHHHVGAPADGVHKGFPAAIFVVEFRFRHAVVDVNGREGQVALFLQLVKPHHAGRGFFGNAFDRCAAFGIKARLFRQPRLDDPEKLFFFLVGRIGQNRRIGLGARADQHQHGCVPAIVEDHVGDLAIAPIENAVGKVPVFGQRFALVGKHRNARLGNRGGRMVLGRKDVARRPAHVCAQSDERFDQHRCLDGHMERSGNARPLEGLAGGIFGPYGHQARHFDLGHLDFLAAIGGQRNVLDGVIGCGAHRPDLHV